MQIKENDKFVATKKTFFLNKGDVVNVTDVNKYGILFTYGENNSHTVFMDTETFENHFEKVVEKKPEVKPNSITAERVQDIIDNCELEIFTIFDKCTVVACKLPNGFVIVESSACVDPRNYDEEQGAYICFDKIVDKIWELEGYSLQNEVGDIGRKATKKYDAEDNCWDTDLDCYDCKDYGCQLNPNTHLNIT